MKKLAMGVALASLILAGAEIYAQPMPGGSHNGMMHGSMMHGGGMWPMGPQWEGPGPMPRHHVAMMWGIPAPYSSMTNPLPKTEATLMKGAKVYADNCEACHGSQGLGDGEAGRDLSPRPGNLAWLSDMPIGQWDPFIYWTVAEGGEQFGTDMPAFKDTLSEDEIWAVEAYVQSHIPQDAAKE